MRIFLLLLSAKVVSQAGANLTSFGLGVWLYQSTGSVMLYSLLVVSGQLPMLLVSPLAGVLTDTWDRGKVLLLAHTGGLLCALLLVVLNQAGALGAGTALLVSAVLACFSAFDFPAFSALTTALVPREQLNRANGLVQAGTGMVQLFCPLAAGFLLPALGLGGLIAINTAFSLLALLTLLVARIPKQPPAAPKPRRGIRLFLREAGEGWRHVRQNPGLLQLLRIVFIFTFCLSVVQVLFSPLVLSFADARTLGIVDSLGGVGFLGGTLLMVAWRGPPRLVYGVLGFTLLQGLLLLVLGASQPSFFVAVLGSFGVLFTFPLISSYSQTLWQHRVPLDLQGRVFALRIMATRTASTGAFLLAGPLVDGLFEPLMAHSGPLAPVLGPLMGTGPGRGAALLIALLGLVTVLTAVLGLRSASMRKLEDGAATPHPPVTGAPAGAATTVHAPR